MTETNMPAAEVTGADEREVVSYELAFHVLPTVAEGEVSGVFNALKQTITDASGDLFDEEQPQRFDLAYEIEKYIDGKYRRFHSAYFGWVRFRLEPAALEALQQEVELNKQVLRYLVVRLSKAEEENPFFFHEALTHRQVTTIEEHEVTELADDADDTETDTETAATDDEEVVTADDATDKKE